MENDAAGSRGFRGSPSCSFLALLRFEQPTLQFAQSCDQPVEMAQMRCILEPFAMQGDRKQRGVGPCLEDRFRHSGAAGNLHAVDDLEMAADHRTAADAAV